MKWIKISLFGAWMLPALYLWAGPEPKSLSSGQFDESNPVLSPDGAKIAFVRKESSKESVWVMDSDGKNAQCILPSANCVKELTFGSGAVLYSAGGQIGLYDLKTKGTRVLTAGDKAVFSPDSTKIAFINKKMVWVCENGQSTVITKEYLGIDIAWHNNEEVIYCGDGNIYRLNIRNKQMITLATLFSSNMYFTKVFPSPDRTQLLALIPVGAVDSGSESRDALYVIRDGKSEELTYGAEASWSPDGKFVVFVDKQKMYRMSLETRQKKRLGGEVGIVSKAVLTPDGKAVIFSSVRNDSNEDGRIDWRDLSSIYQLNLQNE